MGTELEEEELDLIAEIRKLRKKVAELEAEREKFTKGEPSISEIIQETKGTTSDVMAVAGILQKDERQIGAMYKTLDNPRDAAMIHSTGGGFLGTHGNQEKGIPKGVPLSLENYEAYNKVQMAVLVLGQELRVKSEFPIWEAQNKKLWADAQTTMERMMGEQDLDKRNELQRQLEEEMEIALADTFDFWNVPIDEAWIQKYCPMLWAISQKAREIFVTRTNTLEQLAFIMEATGAVVRPGATRSGGEGITSTILEKELEKRQYED